MPQEGGTIGGGGGEGGDGRTGIICRGFGCVPDGNRYYCNSTARVPRTIHMPDGNRYYCNSTAYRRIHMPDGNRYYCNSTARMPRRIHMPDNMTAWRHRQIYGAP